MDIDKMIAWFDSPEGIAFGESYVARIKAEEVILKTRTIKFEKWLKNNSFSELMERLMKEHGEEWRDKCWANNTEPYSNNKLSFVFNYIVQNYEPIKIYWLAPEDDGGYGYLFKGYVFEIICGQGCFNRIWDYKTKEHLFDA